MHRKPHARPKSRAWSKFTGNQWFIDRIKAFEGCAETLCIPRPQAGVALWWQKNFEMPLKLLADTTINITKVL